MKMILLMQNLMVINLETMGTISYKKLMTDNSIRIMMNDIDYLQFYFLGPMDKCSCIFNFFLLKDLSTNYCHIKKIVYVSPGFKLKMTPNNFEVRHHTQIGAQSFAIT
jgi:hypothetical protein